MATSAPAQRSLAAALIVLALALLVPGLVLPVITVRGVLQPDGVARLTPTLLEHGISDESLAAIRPLLNPAMLPFVENAPGGLKGTLVKRLGDQLAAELRKAGDIEVYQQTRSILGSVRYLYSVGSPTAATLILLFSVIVPFTKAGLGAWALYHRDAIVRRQLLGFVAAIAKWSMADVFAVALFITYLAAQATQAAPGDPTAEVVAFTASFGAGFYWFAAYCIVSLAAQQWTLRSLSRAPAPGC